jgi:hypothetical protein
MITIFELARAIRYLYPGGTPGAKFFHKDDNKDDGWIGLWPPELGPEPDAAALDAGLLGAKHSDAIVRLRKESIKRFEGGRRNDVLLARYVKRLRQAVTRLAILTNNEGDPTLLDIAVDLNALESMWHAENMIEADIDAAPDPDVFDDDAIKNSAHWPGGT